MLRRLIGWSRSPARDRTGRWPDHETGGTPSGRTWITAPQNTFKGWHHADGGACRTRLSPSPPPSCRGEHQTSDESSAGHLGSVMRVRSRTMGAGGHVRSVSSGCSRSRAHVQIQYQRPVRRSDPSPWRRGPVSATRCGRWRAEGMATRTIRQSGARGATSVSIVHPGQSGPRLPLDGLAESSRPAELGDHTGDEPTTRSL